MLQYQLASNKQELPAVDGRCSDQYALGLTLHSIVTCGIKDWGLMFLPSDTVLQQMEAASQKQQMAAAAQDKQMQADARSEHRRLLLTGLLEQHSLWVSILTEFCISRAAVINICDMRDLYCQCV